MRLFEWLGPIAALCVVGHAAAAAAWSRGVRSRKGEFGGPLMKSAAVKICSLSGALRDVSKALSAQCPDDWYYHGRGNDDYEEYDEVDDLCVHVRLGARKYASHVAELVTEFFKGNKQDGRRATCLAEDRRNGREPSVKSMDTDGLRECLENSTVASTNYLESVRKVERSVNQLCDRRLMWGKKESGVKLRWVGLFGESAGCHITQQAWINNAYSAKRPYGGLFAVTAMGEGPALWWRGGCEPGRGKIQTLLGAMNKLLELNRTGAKNSEASDHDEGMVTATGPTSGASEVGKAAGAAREDGGKTTHPVEKMGRSDETAIKNSEQEVEASGHPEGEDDASDADTSAATASQQRDAEGKEPTGATHEQGSVESSHSPEGAGAHEREEEVTANNSAADLQRESLVQLAARHGIILSSAFHTTAAQHIVFVLAAVALA
uniref:Uncharacterized protein n=1 Tax=Trypanosoma vivax (strain Y486) TaxID=1055687 RepID=G0U686_TRYVY|nr:hypothetical protein, conserved in T. vivax [Trypanosoma vivax Y486]